MDIKDYLRKKKEEIDSVIEDYLPHLENTPQILLESMKYSLLAGGKRLRPILMLATYEMFAKDYKKILPVSIAVELIHTYSLIHDDLPIMDNDDLRRGRPTNHRIYGDAIALLAGDALLTHAFFVISDFSLQNGCFSDRIIRVLSELAFFAGPSGMIGGQVIDITSENKEISNEELYMMHKHKTGDLINFSVRAGGLLAGCSPEALDLLSIYAYNLGIAFQIRDDILDVTGESVKIGKNIKSDLNNNKVTFVTKYGLNGAEEKMKEHTILARSALKKLKVDTKILDSLAVYLLTREE